MAALRGKFHEQYEGMGPEMVATIIFGALLTGVMGAATAITLGAAWWIVVLAFVGAGNLGTGLIVVLSFLRSNDRPGGPLGQTMGAPALSRQTQS